MSEQDQNRPGDVVRVEARPGYATRRWSCDGYFVDYRDVRGRPGFRVNWGDENDPITADFPLETHQVTGFPLLHELRAAVAAGSIELDEAVRRVAAETDTELSSVGAREWLVRDGGESHG